MLWGLSQLSTLIIPLMIAALLAGLLLPVKRALRRWGMSNGVSTATTFLLFLIVVGGVLTLVGTTMATGLRGLWKQALEGIDTVRTWLTDGPLHITNDQMNQFFDTGLKALQSNQDTVVKNAASGVTAVTHLGAGLLLCLFALIFFLLEGERIWRWVVGLFPAPPGLPSTARAAEDGSAWSPTFASSSWSH